MADGKTILLAEGPPVFCAKGGHFYVDVGIADAPLLAYSPHDFLEAVRSGAAAYSTWVAEQKRAVAHVPFGGEDAAA